MDDYKWMEEASQAAMEEIRHINQWTEQQANVLQQGKGHGKN